VVFILAFVWGRRHPERAPGDEEPTEHDDPPGRSA